jgi:hypothetical protein
MIFARRGVLVLAGSVGGGISLRAIYFKGKKYFTPSIMPQDPGEGGNIKIIGEQLSS